MPSIADAREAIKTQVATLLRCHDYMPQQIAPPCVIVGLPTNYDVNDTQGDTATLTIPVMLYVPYASNRAAEDQIERYLATSGDDSVLALIEAAGEGYAVTGVRDFGTLDNTQGTPTALGCTIEVTVYA